MKQQNVTISLPEDLVREARHLAVDQGISLSKFVANLVAERVRSRQEYEEARERHLSILKEGLDLGTHGQVPWTRDELYER